MELKQLAARLDEIAAAYPPQFRARQKRDVPRIAFHVALVAARVPPGGRVCDLGGGAGMFSLGCATVGLRAIVVDSFAEHDPAAVDPALELHHAMGVEVIRRDLIEEPLGMEAGSLDAVTMFQAIEHLHHSPKRLFHEVCTALRPRGLFVLSGPNSANLRKRITAPLGRMKWSTMEAWYESERFRGHVREPDIHDLRYIARDLDLRDVELFGRNWMGYGTERAMRRALVRVTDPLLRARPTLCSNIYLVGRKASA